MSPNYSLILLDGGPILILNIVRRKITYSGHHKLHQLLVVGLDVDHELHKVLELRDFAVGLRRGCACARGSHGLVVVRLVEGAMRSLDLDGLLA